MSADAQEHSLIILLQRIQISNRSAGQDLDAQIADPLDLLIQHALGKPIIGDTIAQHSASLGPRLIDRNRVAELRQILCRSQATRATPDHGYSLLTSHRLGRHRLVAVFSPPIGHESLEARNGDWFLIHELPAASRLARMIADPPTNRRERVGHSTDFESLGIATLGDQGNIPLGAGPSGAGVPAGRCASLVDGHDVGYSLREGPVDGLARPHPLIKLAGHLNRACGIAVCTPRAALLINETRLVADSHLEITRLTIYRLQLGPGHEIDIQVTGALDNLRREDTHGTVISGKGFIQLRHGPADRRRAL